MTSRAAVRCLLIAVVVCAVACGGGSDVVPSEVAIFSGPRFWTNDPTHPWADALLVSEGRIVRTIERSEIPRQVAAGGEIVQLAGDLAVPGLVDAHAHLAGYAVGLTQVDLTGTATIDDALAHIDQFARQHPKARWILGRGWDQNDWPDKTWPDADRLEQVVAGRPCALARVDGHAQWLNRTALAAAGITAATRDPSGGKIHRDSMGRPTGILIDEALKLVEAKIPEPTPDELVAALETAGKRLASVGLTGVHDMGMRGNAWAALEELQRERRFPLRVTAYADFDGDLPARLAQAGPLTTGRLRLVGVKFYADGALGSRGARLLAPYDDEPSTSGLWVTEPDVLAQRVADAANHHLQPAVHAIGDAANRAALDAYARLGDGVTTVRPRIEHAQILDPADIPRFAKLGVIASMQPTHATSDMPWAVDRLGAGRLAGAYTWRSLLQAGAALAFGSDFPVESIDPRLGLYAAVTRQDNQGEPPGGWLPDQKLTLAEALGAFTSGAAFAGHTEDSLGRLAPGYWCDLTVFDRNLFDRPPHEILESHVTATVVAGKRIDVAADAR